MISMDDAPYAPTTPGLYLLEVKGCETCGGSGKVEPDHRYPVSAGSDRCGPCGGRGFVRGWRPYPLAVAPQPSPYGFGAVAGRHPGMPVEGPAARGGMPKTGGG